MKYKDLETEMAEDLAIRIESSPGKKRANKPLMERKRRARINQSLTQLKALVLEGMKKDPTRYSRLEKADILEMTVTHLKSVHRHRIQGADADTSSRYRAGFVQCAAEVKRYLGKLDDLDDSIKSNIINHLTANIHRNGKEKPQMNPQEGAAVAQGGLFMLVTNADGTAAVPIPVSAVQKLPNCAGVTQHTTPTLHPSMAVACLGRVPKNGTNVVDTTTASGTLNGTDTCTSTSTIPPTPAYRMVFVPGQGYALMMDSFGQVKPTVDCTNQVSPATTEEPLSLVVQKDPSVNPVHTTDGLKDSIKREPLSKVDSDQQDEDSKENSVPAVPHDCMWRPW